MAITPVKPASTLGANTQCGGSAPAAAAAPHRRGGKLGVKLTSWPVVCLFRSLRLPRHTVLWRREYQHCKREGLLPRGTCCGTVWA